MNDLKTTNKSVNRVMLVDDSAVIKRFYKMFLSSEDDMLVVCEAENGFKAIDLARSSKPDIIILDIEMPLMDGIAALPKLLEVSPESKIIMSYTLTTKNAEIAIKAISLGASDYIEKPASDSDKAVYQKELIEKIRAFSAHAQALNVLREKPKESLLPRAPEKVSFKNPVVIAIGCSTGGPQALDTLFKGLRNEIKDIPIFITQHMPPKFTKLLAENLGQTSGADCFEAEDGMEVVAGKIYLAPGDYHMTVKKEGVKKVVRLNQDDPENFCRPSVNPMMRSIVDVYGSGVLAVIMTGMGQDGLEGVRSAVQKGGNLIIQDQETSTVWGMPGAVARENLQHGTYPLGDLATKILEIYKGV